MEGWGGISLSGVTATGNLTQLYPNFVSAGDALPIAAMGTLRRPSGGRVGQVSIKTDQTNGGVIELWDISGLDIAADVSASTAITNTQLTTLQTAGKARLLWSQNFAATPASPAPWSLGMGFMKGVAARFVTNGGAGGGTCSLNVIAEGGFYKQIVPCGFAG